MKTYEETVKHYADIYYHRWMSGDTWITMPELSGVCFIFERNHQEVYNEVKRLTKEKINAQAR